MASARRLGGEVDEGVDRDAVDVKRSGLRGERLGGRDPLTGGVRAGDRALDDGPHRLAGHAVERVGHGLLGELNHRLDFAAVDDDVHQDRGHVVVVVPQVVVHGLEVPHHLAGLGPHADEAVGVEVVAGAVPAVHVVAGGPRRQIDEPELFVGAHHRPHVAHARVLPRVVEPGLDARLAGPGNRVPGPPQGPRADVVGADVAGAVLLRQGMVGHGLSDHDHVAHDEGRRRVVEVDPLRGVLEDPEIDPATVAEAADQPAGIRIGGQEVRRPHRQDAAAGSGVVLPVADPAVGGPPRGLVVGEERQVLHPAGLAGRGVERLDNADAVRRVQHAVDHQRRRPQVVRVAQVIPARVQAGVDGGAAPHDIQVVDGLRIDLIERRVAGETAVAAVDAPLAAGPVLGRRGPRHGECAQQGRHRQTAAGRSRCPLVPHRFPVSCLTPPPARAPPPARRRLKPTCRNPHRSAAQTPGPGTAACDSDCRPTPGSRSMPTAPTSGEEPRTPSARASATRSCRPPRPPQGRGPTPRSRHEHPRLDRVDQLTVLGAPGWGLRLPPNHAGEPHRACGADRYRMAENAVGTSIRDSIVSTSFRSSERSAEMMIRWNSGFSASLAHISSRDSSVGYPSM